MGYPNIMGKLLSTSEVAERLDVTRRRVVALINSDKLPAERVGRVWVVDEEELATFLKTWDRSPGRRPEGS